MILKRVLTRSGWFLNRIKGFLDGQDSNHGHRSALPSDYYEHGLRPFLHDKTNFRLAGSFRGDPRGRPKNQHICLNLINSTNIKKGASQRPHLWFSLLGFIFWH